MNHIEKAVKPILTDLGLFNGKEVSAKEVFGKYLERFPKGVGPLGVFIRLVENKFSLKTEFNDTNTDFVFSYSHDPERDLLEYDPRTIKS